jgi:hypothetical protein
MSRRFSSACSIGGSRGVLGADSGEVAQAFRDNVAQGSDMMPPGSGASLTPDGMTFRCHRLDPVCGAPSAVASARGRTGKNEATGCLGEHVSASGPLRGRQEGEVTLQFRTESVRRP